MKILNGTEIANNIKAERSRAGITIDDVCKTLNISRPTYIEYEKNAEVVKVTTLIKLASLFNCNIDMFFYSK